MLIINRQNCRKIHAPSLVDRLDLYIVFIPRELIS